MYAYMYTNMYVYMCVYIYIYNYYTYIYSYVTRPRPPLRPRVEVFWNTLSFYISFPVPMLRQGRTLNSKCCDLKL